MPDIPPPAQHSPALAMSYADFIAAFSRHGYEATSATRVGREAVVHLRPPVYDARSIDAAIREVGAASWSWGRIGDQHKTCIVVRWGTRRERDRRRERRGELQWWGKTI